MLNSVQTPKQQDSIMALSEAFALAPYLSHTRQPTEGERPCLMKPTTTYCTVTVTTC